MTSDLAVRDASALDLTPRFVTSIAELADQLHQLEQFKRDIMIEGVDYGVIPGTPKPTLLKPGAEKLSLAFGLAPTFESANTVEDWEKGFFHYDERCVLTSRRAGAVVASANGSANSREPRYRWRDAKPTCPDCNFELRRSKRTDDGPGGWYCWAKIGGCGAQWPAETVKSVGRVENPEPYELVNTIKKMAQKRALVAAVLIATGGSGIWTQDIEDMPSVTGEDRTIDVTPRQTNGHATTANTAPAASQSRATPPAPRNARQAAAQATLKPTTTKCSVCDRMVESENLLRDSQTQFAVPMCVAHFNQALDQGKPDAEREQELPL